MALLTTKKISKIDSELLTEYILSKYGKMSHLKLQKLLYYVQAFHLAYFDSPLIDDDFEAIGDKVVTHIFGFDFNDFEIGQFDMIRLKVFIEEKSDRR